MTLTGVELFESVFKDFVDEYGIEGFEFYEIEDFDEVTCYDEDLSYHSGWYIYYTISFRYRGKKYAFEKKEHTSDNVSDTDYLIDTFHEVVETDAPAIKEVNKIIGYIEDELYANWEEVVRDLENVKKVIINNYDR